MEWEEFRLWRVSGIIMTVTTTLYLTESERALWSGISPKLQSQYAVEHEVGNWRDSPGRRRMRMQLVQLRDPKLLAFLESAKAAQSAEALAALLMDTDLQGIADADIAELFFALGPAAVSSLIASMLGRVASDSDLQGIAALTTIRHSLYASLASVSH
jgi:hypothetical protein